MPALLKLEGVPTLVCALQPTRAAARACPRGVIELWADERTGLVHNRAFHSELASYEEGYENSLSVSPTFAEWLDELARAVVHSFDLEGRTVVEVGSGDGEFLAALVKHGVGRAQGFEPSWPAAAETSRREGRIRIWPQAFIPGRPLPEDFSEPALIVSRQVLEHVDDPVLFLRGLHALCPSSRARLLIEVPSAEFMAERGTPWEVVYEHRSYFTSAALEACLLAAGWQPRLTRRTFYDQFLMTEATALPEAGVKVPASSSWAETWSETCRTRILHWRARLSSARAKGERLALWGCGARGATFLNLVDPEGTIAAAVDLNERKHGRFIPGTGQEVLPPAALKALDPDAVILLNPLYEKEVRRDLDALGLNARILCD